MIRITTEASLWSIDPDAKIVSRVPLNEDPTHINLPYSLVGQPQEFDEGPVFFHEGPHERCKVRVRSLGWVSTGVIVNKEEF